MDITIKQGDAIAEDEFLPLYNMLSKIKVRQNSSDPRGGFGVHRAMTFGLTIHRYKGRELRPSWASTKYPTMHTEIFRLGHLYCPHPFNSVHLNSNVTCPPHVDGNNNGESTVVSFGPYSGGVLMVEGHPADAYCRPITFDGNRLIHWNTPDLVGIKYSLVFYNSQQR